MLLNNLAILCFVILSLYKVIKNKGGFKKWNIVQILFVCLYSVGLISLSYTCDSYEGYKVLEKYLVFALFPFLFSTTNLTKKEVKDLLLIFSYTITLYLITSFLIATYKSVLNGSIYLFNSENLAIENQFRYHSLIGYFENTAITFGIYTLFAISILLEELIRLKTLSKLKIISLAILIVGAFLMDSFAIIIAFGLILFMILFFIKIKTKYYILLIFPIIFAGYLFHKKAEGFEKKILYYEFEHDVHNKNWNSLNIRLAKWECAVEVINENFPLGVGVGCSQIKLNEKYQENNFVVGLEKRFSTHNQFLHYLVETGVLGLIVYMLILLRGFLLSYKHNNFILLALVCLLFICGLTDTILIINKGIIFFTFYIILLSLPHKNHHEET